MAILFALLGLVWLLGLVVWAPDRWARAAYALCVLVWIALFTKPGF